MQSQVRAEVGAIGSKCFRESLKDGCHPEGWRDFTGPWSTPQCKYFSNIH